MARILHLPLGVPNSIDLGIMVLRVEAGAQVAVWLVRGQRKKAASLAETKWRRTGLPIGTGNLIRISPWTDSAMKIKTS
jgi:hypothetical protein